MASPWEAARELRELVRQLRGGNVTTNEDDEEDYDEYDDGKRDLRYVFDDKPWTGQLNYFRNNDDVETIKDALQRIVEQKNLSWPRKQAAEAALAAVDRLAANQTICHRWLDDYENWTERLNSTIHQSERRVPDWWVDRVHLLVQQLPANPSAARPGVQQALVAILAILNSLEERGELNDAINETAGLATSVAEPDNPDNPDNPDLHSKLAVKLATIPATAKHPGKIVVTPPSLPPSPSSSSGTPPF